MVVFGKIRDNLIPMEIKNFQVKDEFVERYKNLLGKDYDKFMEYNKSHLNRCIRINPLKTENTNKIIEELSDNWILEKIPWSDYGYWIRGENRRDIGNLISHRMGFFYIQEAASQIPPIVLDPKEGEIVLDMAAAPGSKTTQMAGMMNNKGVIISNDLSFARLSALKVNINRSGAKNVIMTNMNGLHFGNVAKSGNLEKIKTKGSRRKNVIKIARQNNYVYENLYKKETNLNSENGYFDKILLDAPCTGSGTLRKSPGTFRKWNIGSIKKMAAEQRKLIDVAFNILKTGGTLVYSTCSIEPEENEFIVDYLIKKYNNAKIVEIKNLEGLKREAPILEFNDKKLDDSIKKSIRLYAHTNDTEGFFICKIKKE